MLKVSKRARMGSWALGNYLFEKLFPAMVVNFRGLDRRRMKSCREKERRGTLPNELG